MRVTPAYLLSAMLIFAAPPAVAEVSELQITLQHGLNQLPLMLLQRDHLVEKQAASRGISDLKVVYRALAGPAAMVDGMLAGTIHVAQMGPPSLAVLWDKTKGAVKSVGSICVYNMYLNTRNPNIKSIRDFTDKDRIAMPGIKTSATSILLQMAAEKAFGTDQAFKFDSLTVGLSHPDAMTAVLNPASEISAHFTSSPFHEREIKAGLHTITTAYEISGGPETSSLLTTSAKFRAENPKLYASVVAAVDEAIAWLKADPRRAMKAYLEISRDTSASEDDGTAMLSSPDIEFTRTPHKIGPLLQFMHKTGLIKTQAEGWKDLFFEEAWTLPGS